MEGQVGTSEPALVVDIDGTLLKADLLVEGALALALRAPLTMLRWPAWLMRGKAALKREIAARAPLPVESLPVNETVVDLLKREKARGRQIYIASAADRAWAEAVAARFGLFDGVFASDGATNLAGAAKARRLIEAFGPGGFDYIGNGRADLPVWAAARKAMLAGVPDRIAAKARGANAQAEVVDPRTRSPAALLKALRPHQWVKNLLVFLPVLAAHQTGAAGLGASAVAFVALCLCASAGYIVNDLADLANDRRHPRKRQRPFASGTLSPLGGAAAAALLAVAGLGAASSLSWPVAAAVAGYLVLSLAYSFDLKRRLMLDVFALAALYTIRIGIGGIATGIVVSEWLFAFSVFLFLSLAMVKRCTELAKCGAPDETRVASRGYHASDVGVVSALAVAAGFSAVLVLALYVSSAAATSLYARPYLLWGVCFLLAYWLARIFVLARRGHLDDDPILFAFRDKASLAAGAAVAALVLGAI